MSLFNVKIGFIGAGNMAQAIGDGWVKKNAVKPSQIYVSAPSENNFEPWKRLGVNTSTSSGLTVDSVDIVILACKPYQLENALKGIRSTCSNAMQHKQFVSILAGITIETLDNNLRNILGILEPPIIRSIPNTPMMVGEGCCAISPNTHTKVENTKLLASLFSLLGKCEIVPESLINPFAGLAGSGPAYIYLVIEALADGAVKNGLPRHMATTFAAQTVMGAARMVLETKKHPGQLKDEVCSPNGTTICGINVLEDHKVRAAFMGAVSASVKRGEEIGKQAK